MNHDQLPPTIRSVYPKNSNIKLHGGFHSARQLPNGDIVVYVNYDSTGDRWSLVNGRWTYLNPGPSRYRE